MTPAITFEELLGWNEESSAFWKAHLAAHPALLQLPCDIVGTENVQEFVRHIWGVELRWGQRLAGLPVTEREQMPTGPLDTLFDLHVQAGRIFRGLLTAPAASWDEPYVLDVSWAPPGSSRSMTRRKIFGHAVFHSQRHWAQLATLVRAAGFPSEFRGDLLFSLSLR